MAVLGFRATQYLFPRSSSLFFTLLTDTFHWSIHSLKSPPELNQSTMTSTYTRFDTVFLFSRFAGAKYSPLLPSPSFTLSTSGIHIRTKPNSRFHSIIASSSSSSVVAGTDSIEVIFFLSLRFWILNFPWSLLIRFFMPFCVLD